MEQSSFCKNEIARASSFVELAGRDLVVNDVSIAKSTLQLAIQALAYSTVEECSQAININDSKNELQKILEILSS